MLRDRLRSLAASSMRFSVALMFASRVGMFAPIMAMSSGPFILPPSVGGVLVPEPSAFGALPHDAFRPVELKPLVLAPDESAPAPDELASGCFPCLFVEGFAGSATRGRRQGVRSVGSEQTAAARLQGGTSGGGRAKSTWRVGVRVLAIRVVCPTSETQQVVSLRVATHLHHLVSDVPLATPHLRGCVTGRVTGNVMRATKVQAAHLPSRREDLTREHVDAPACQLGLRAQRIRRLRAAGARLTARLHNCPQIFALPRTPQSARCHTQSAGQRDRR